MVKKELFFIGIKLKVYVFRVFLHAPARFRILMSEAELHTIKTWYPHFNSQVSSTSRSPTKGR